ncbi:MAG TPA: hypothetical protein ENF87_01885 [Thermoproteales archaeon]|nr:hypothetical protein [Thermoproteales archaeon]
MYVRPVSTIRRLSEDPDYLGPLILIGLILLAYLGNLVVLSVKSEYYVQGVWKPSWNVEVSPVLSLLLASRLLYVIFTWFSYFFLVFVFSRLLGSDKELYPLFSISGYILHIFLLQLVLNAIVLSIASLSIPHLRLIGLYEGHLRVATSAAFEEWQKVVIVKVLNKPLEWLAYFWGGLYTYLVFREEREVDRRRAVIGTLATYALNSIIAMIFAVQFI